MPKKSNQNREMYAVPELDVNGTDITDFHNKLKAFAKEFDGCFKRKEPRSHFYNFMLGRFSGLKRKSITQNTSKSYVRVMQRFVSDAPWDDEKIMDIYHNLIKSTLGSPEGALIFNELKFYKKGKNSIGVAQYSSTRDNYQLGLFATYASPLGSCIANKRLFIPSHWFKDSYEKRRKKCKLPDTIQPQTQSQLATTMLKEIWKKGILPFKYIICISDYSGIENFIQTTQSIPETIFFVKVTDSIQCEIIKTGKQIQKQELLKKRREQKKKELQKRMERKQHKTGKKQQQKTKKERGENDKEEKKAMLLREIAKLAQQKKANLKWYDRRIFKETELENKLFFTRQRINLYKTKISIQGLWVLIIKDTNKAQKYSYYLSNASESVRLEYLIWLFEQGHTADKTLEQAKSQLCMDKYEVRKYFGWHHYILTCMLGHFFLCKEKPSS